MKTSIKKYVIIIIFMFSTCSAYIVWPFLNKYIDTKNYENRNLTSRPTLSLDNITEFPHTFERYIDDNLPFRNQMIHLNNSIQYSLFNNSTDNRVIIGKNNWLFYNNVADGNPIAAYKGEQLFSQEQLAQIAQAMTATRDNLAAEGCEFVLFIAPNKERIYAENMPSYYSKPAEMYPTLQLVEYLTANTDIRVVYPYQELMEAKYILGEETLLYRKTDTHWNAVGGYIGAAALLKELNIEMPALNSDKLSITASTDTPGDLANMLHLGASISTGMTYQISGYDTHEMVNEKWDFSTEAIYHNTGADPRRIFIVRDSFASAMCDVIGSQFNESYMIHKDAYSNDLVRQWDPDIYVYEMVERSVPNIHSFVYE